MIVTSTFPCKAWPDSKKKLLCFVSPLQSRVLLMVCVNILLLCFFFTKIAQIVKILHVIKSYTSRYYFQIPLIIIKGLCQKYQGVSFLLKSCMTWILQCSFKCNIGVSWNVRGYVYHLFITFHFPEKTKGNITQEIRKLITLQTLVTCDPSTCPNNKSWFEWVKRSSIGKI